MATVIIPALLRKLTGGKDRALATGTTLKQVIDDLEQQFPGFRQQIIEEGDINSSLAVSIDGEIVSGGLSESVQPHSEIHFIPAISGGSGQCPVPLDLWEIKGLPPEISLCTSTAWRACYEVIQKEGSGLGKTPEPG